MGQALSQAQGSREQDSFRRWRVESTGGIFPW